MAELYGGFTMPGENFFYLSSMYSDKLLTEFLPVVKNRAYQRYMQIQKNILNSNEVFGSLEKNSKYQYYFKESVELDNAFGFPIGSMYADITNQDFYLDIGDKLKFLKKFKSFNTPISSTDLIENPDIFTHVIRCMIGGFSFNKFYIIKDKYHRVYIAIKNNAKDGIANTTWKRLISEGNESNPTTFCFWKDRPSAMYTYTGMLNSIIFNSTTSGMKRITIPKTNSVTPVRPLNENNWTFVVSYDTTRYGQYLYSIADASLVSETSANLIFDVKASFLSDITSRNVTVSCAVFQRLNRKAIYSFTPSSSNEPWLTLGDVDRPVSIANVKIYKYDPAIDRYKERIPIEVNNFNKEFNEKINNEKYNEKDYFTNVIFPSIYRFNNIDGPIHIELIEYTPEVSNTEFDNHLKPLFNYGKTDPHEYSADSYLEYLTFLNTDESTSDTLSKLTGFNPMNVYMDYMDYLKSNKKNMREYKFGKLMELIASDPYLYTEYIKFMDNENFNIIRQSGSPNHFKFNTGITTDKELTGNNPVVMDDSFVCVNKNDDVFFFSEPHSYIKVHSTNADAFCVVYVGGRMITPTRIKSKLNDIYIFFPQSTMKKYVEETMESLKSTNKTVMTKYNMITVEIYTKINRSTSDQIHYSSVFDSMTLGKKLFDGDENFTFKLADLVIYNKTTGEYIPLNKFDITAILNQATIEFDDGTSDEVIGTTKDIIYLGTNAAEFYMTRDNYRIILDDVTYEIMLPTDDSTGSRKDGYSGYLNKEWTANDLRFILNDPKLIGSEIEFVYSPVGYSWNTSLDRFTKDEATGTYSYRLGGFIGNANYEQFELYINGEFVKNYKSYLTLPDGVGTNDYILINIPADTIKKYYNSNTTFVQLLYNPTTYSYETSVSHYKLPSVNTLAEADYNYSVFDTDLYECISNRTIHFNSDNSKVFISDNNHDTQLSSIYTWKKDKEEFDLQDMFCVSKLHPIVGDIPVFKDIKRDVSFADSYYGLVQSTIDSIARIVE